MKTLSILFGATMLTLSAQTLAASPGAAMPVNPYLQGNPYLQHLPAYMPFGITLPPKQPAKPWTMSPIISREEKTRIMRQIMPMLPAFTRMDIRDVMSFMATKYKAKEGLSFDDVVESMKLRANALNFKLVGHSPMWKDIKAVLEDNESPRMEVFHFCDIKAGREVMKLAPEAIVFLPCRIAVMEDAEKNIWVLTLDWDMAWLDGINGSLGITPELATMARDIREKIDNIMQAAANGDL